MRNPGRGVVGMNLTANISTGIGASRLGRDPTFA
jgi:hypothetical protein